MEEELSQQDLTRGIRFKILGTLSYSIGAPFFTGAILTGYLVYIGASDSLIGLASAVPQLMILSQLFGLYFLTRYHSHRKVFVHFAVIGRIISALVIFLPFVEFGLSKYDKIFAFIILMSVSTLFSSIATISISSWMVNFVPNNIRGRFQSKLGIISGITSLVLAIAPNKFIDWWYAYHHKDDPWGFVILITISIIFDIGCILFNALVPDIKVKKKKPIKEVFSSYFEVFKDKNFVRLLTARSYFMFIASLVGPYVMLFYLRNIKMSYTDIALYNTTIPGLVSLALIGVWGRLVDKYGGVRIMKYFFIVSAPFSFVTVFLTESNWYIWLPVVNIVSSLIVGMKLGYSVIVYNIIPKEKAASYLIVDSMVLSLVGAIGGFAGSIFVQLFENTKFEFLGVEFDNIRLVFILFAVTRALSYFFWAKIKVDEGERTFREMLKSIELIVKINFENVVEKMEYVLHLNGKNK